jgi:hypothetical protein
MAKKSRTPPPPRKVQAPRQRAAAREGVSDATKRWILYALAAAGLVGVVVAVVVIATAGGGGGASAAKVAQTLRAAGCTYKVYPATSQAHVALSAKVKYNSVPPSNGPHYGVPALWGIYTDPVRQLQAVHNLEHGGMLIEYGARVSQAQVDKITAFYNRSPDGMLVFPYARLRNKIAFVAWTADLSQLASSRTGGYHGEGRVAICARFNEKAATAFQKAFRAKGPERFPLSALKPGT